MKKNTNVTSQLSSLMANPTITSDFVKPDGKPSSSLGSGVYGNKKAIVQFRKNGATFQFNNVKKADFEALTSAASPGNHYKNVFRHKYNGNKIN